MKTKEFVEKMKQKLDEYQADFDANQEKDPVLWENYEHFEGWFGDFCCYLEMKEDIDGF